MGSWRVSHIANALLQVLSGTSWHIFPLWSIINIYFHFVPTNKFYLMIQLYRERGGNNIPVWNLEITFMVNCLSGHFSLLGNSKVTSYKLVSEIVRENVHSTSCRSCTSAYHEEYFGNRWPAFLLCYYCYS